MSVIPVTVGLLALTLPVLAQAAPAYWVAEFDVTDAGKLKEFGAASNAIVTKYGGTFLSRRNKPESYVGTAPGSVTIIQFESLEKAKEYANSPENKAIEALRNQAGKWHIFYVTGGDNSQ